MTVVALTKPGVQGQGALILKGEEESALVLARQTRGWAFVGVNPG